jgi:hypothetical protein
MSRPKVLFAYSVLAQFTSAVREYVLAFKKWSDMDVDYINVTHGAIVDIDFNAYDVVIQNFCARFAIDSMGPSYLANLGKFRGVKVMIVQDEYDFTNKTRAAIVDYEFDIVLTAVCQEGLEYVYGRSELPHVEFITVLTGYVSDKILERGKPVNNISGRTIHVGYRGRNIGPRYGTLGYLKHIIGDKFAEQCASRGLPFDIATDEQSRIYGDKWYDFVGSCRSMLGTESGSNVFDFDGEIFQQTQAEFARLGQHAPYEDWLPKLRPLEANIQMGAVSPRFFECSAMLTPMILSRGRYSDMAVADEHYIPIEQDFSNFDEVFEKLADTDFLEKISHRCYDDFVASGNWNYSAFVGMVEKAIRTRLDQSPRRVLADPTPKSDAKASALESEITELPLPCINYNIAYFRFECEKIISNYENMMTTSQDAFETSRLNLDYCRNLAIAAGRDLTSEDSVFPMSSYDSRLAEMQAIMSVHNDGQIRWNQLEAECAVISPPTSDEDQPGIDSYRSLENHLMSHWGNMARDWAKFTSIYSTTLTLASESQQRVVALIESKEPESELGPEAVPEAKLEADDGTSVSLDPASERAQTEGLGSQSLAAPKTSQPRWQSVLARFFPGLSKKV